MVTRRATSSSPASPGASRMSAWSRDGFATLLAEAMVDLNQRVAPLWSILVAEALVDSELEQRHQSMLASITRSTRALVVLCEERGWTSGTMTRDQRAAALLTIGSTDSYQRATAGVGLDDADYREWLRTCILLVLRG